MKRILIENSGIDPMNCSYGCPWKYDATAFNFKAPNEALKASEIDSIDYMEDIESLIIGCDLDNYDFIGNMVNLRQLYIYTGNNIKDLSFIRKLQKLSHLYISDSFIDSLDDLVELINEQKRQFDDETDPRKRLFMLIDAICINSSNELDGSVILETGVHIGEVIINKEWLEKR